jgi:hypothetical protein
LSGSEAMGQEFLRRGMTPGILQVQQQHAATRCQLKHNLATRATGAGNVIGWGYDRDCNNLPLSGGVGAEERHTLRTEGYRVGRIFDVTAGEDVPRCG